MKAKRPFISIIIPVESKTKYLDQALTHYAKQTYKNFEVIIASTRSFSRSFSVPYSFVQVIVNKRLAGDVAAKRNQILKYGKGEIFVFNDDDVFTPLQYLKGIIDKLKIPKILAVCGPLLTPPEDSFLQQASGAVWESYLGSFGAGVYRNRKLSARIVYDFPAANLIVRRKVFQEIGGFQPGLYPGEDTKLCLDIFNRYKRGVFYDPSLFVYHHRKPLFKAHLLQVGRYGGQRGGFALAYPETSFKIQYFLPSLFLAYIIDLILISSRSLFISDFVFPSLILTPLLIYLGLTFLEGIGIVFKKGVEVAILAMIGIFLTHLYYGYRFAKSFVGKIVFEIITFLKLFRRL